MSENDLGVTPGEALPVEEMTGSAIAGNLEDKLAKVQAHVPYPGATEAYDRRLAKEKEVYFYQTVLIEQLRQHGDIVAALRVAEKAVEGMRKIAA